jgi:hypothetical protein
MAGATNKMVLGEGGDVEILLEDGCGEEAPWDDNDKVCRVPK